MENKIEWANKMDEALARARSDNKPVLLDFFNPGWIGCQQMDAVTYPDARVISFVNENMIPLRVRFDAQPLATDFNVKWTPTIVTLDPEGKEHHRTVGFLAPEEFIPSLLLGIGKVYFDTDRFDAALANLEKLLSGYPKSHSAHEAIYLRGVSLYKKTDDPKPLKRAYEKLQENYPGSEWTKRAYPYRLL